MSPENVEKKREREHQWRVVHKQEQAEYRRKYYAAHREELVEYGRKYYMAHKEECAERRRIYYQKHKQERKESHRKWAAAHKEERKEYNRNWCIAHPDQHRITAKKSNRKMLLVWRQKVFDLLGERCVSCGYTDRRALQIDHIHGGGGKERDCGLVAMYRRIIRLGGEGYQILCANCNCIKMVENDENRVHNSVKGA